MLFVLALMLSACGSTSKLHKTQNPSINYDLSSYNCVVVNDFADGVSKSNSDEKIINAGKKFADTIASEIESKKVFNNVERNANSTNSCLLIDGKVTKCDEGNAAARMLFGFGAGSSHFDADVYIRDNKTNQILGEIKVGQMSWALGGAIAASQDVFSHIKTASSKIARELVLAKKQAAEPQK